MYEKKVGRAYQRGCLLGCGAQAVGLVLGVVLVGSVLLLIDGGRVEPRSGRFALALLAPTFMILGVLLVGFVWVWRRGRRLDEAFAQFGWRGRQTGGVMRSWHGEIDGREVNAWFHKGPTLELFMSCRPETRGVVHTGGPLIRTIAEQLDRRPPLDPPPFRLEGATFYCFDPEWMRRLFERAAAENTVRSLMTDTYRTASSVLFLPNAVRYMRRFMPVAEVNAENVRGWLTELGVLASEVDRLGPSADRLEPKKFEEWARTRRGKHLNTVLLVMAMILLASMGSLFVFGWFFVGQS